MFRRFPRYYKGLGEHCVSHPFDEYFAYFLNNYMHFHADCVSCHLRINPEREWIGHNHGRGFGLSEPGSEPLLAVVARIASVPITAGAAVTLALAGSLAADLLSLARACIRQEPTTTNPARALLTHAPVSHSGQGVRSTLAALARSAWVHSS